MAAMTLPTTGTQLQKGFRSLREIFEIWETQTGLTIESGLIGDASGGKPMATKIIAIARVHEEDLQSREAIEQGATFSVKHPIDEATEILPVIGIIKEGEIEFYCGDDEATKYFTKLGRAEDVRFFDAVGDEEAAERDFEKKAKKAAKKARQKEKKAAGKESGKQDP